MPFFAGMNDYFFNFHFSNATEVEVPVLPELSAGDNEKSINDSFHMLLQAVCLPVSASAFNLFLPLSLISNQQTTRFLPSKRVLFAERVRGACFDGVGLDVAALEELLQGALVGDMSNAVLAHAHLAHAHLAHVHLANDTGWPAVALSEDSLDEVLAWAWESLLEALQGIVIVEDLDGVGQGQEFTTGKAVC